MSDEVQVDGHNYTSSKRAAQLSGYAQDYIGQLARKELIDARRIGGLWYISMDSLSVYQKKAEEFKPVPPTRKDVKSDPDTLIFFDGKPYLSAARAAETTGYAQDYVGQLARSGIVLSQQVGNRWYVEKESLLRHKAEKDALLAAVQSESVGLPHGKRGLTTNTKYQANSSNSGYIPTLNYFNEDDDLLPVLGNGQDEPTVAERTQDSRLPKVDLPQAYVHMRTATVLPIRKTTNTRTQSGRNVSSRQTPLLDTAEGNSKRSVTFLLGAAATIIIILSVGYTSVLKQNSVYASNIRNISTTALPASVYEAFGKIGDILEPYLTHELTYQSSQAQ